MSRCEVRCTKSKFGRYKLPKVERLKVHEDNRVVDEWLRRIRRGRCRYTKFEAILSECDVFWVLMSGEIVLVEWGKSTGFYTMVWYIDNAEFPKVISKRNQHKTKHRKVQPVTCLKGMLKRLSAISQVPVMPRRRSDRSPMKHPTGDCYGSVE